MSGLIQSYLFVVFALLAVLFSLIVVTVSNAVTSALALVFVFFASAAIWILLQTEFLPLILVLVYVGAVMTLFLFVVMMIDVEHQPNIKRMIVFLPATALVAAVIVGAVHLFLPSLAQMGVDHIDPTYTSDTLALGKVIYTDYVLPFELAAAILLVAIIAAITLTHRQVIRSKRQNTVEQLMVTKSERLKIMTMAPVKKERY